MELHYSAQELLRFARIKPAGFWVREGERHLLQLFRRAAREVPAYKDFLKKNKVDPDKIATVADFRLVPPVSKKEYLCAYPLEKLCWQGKVASEKTPTLFSVTSGSTGEPFYFPRSTLLDWQSSLMHELFFSYRRGQRHDPTLVVVCFGMGVWIGGLITYAAFRGIADRGGRPLAIITPGINKREIFHALARVGDRFAGVILCGYPPFIKDVVDEAITEGVAWKKLRPRFVFAAEGFSEKFRDYIARKSGLENIYTDTMNIYGSADLGTMAQETPLSVFLRREALRHKELFGDLFPIHMRRVLPTLVQANPLFTYFEGDENGGILASGDNTLPLIRYAIGDRGGVIPFEKVREMLYDQRVDTGAFLGKARQMISPAFPFVYLYEREDFSVKLYGAIIYPEHIREALQRRAYEKILSGKFVMLIRYDRRQRQDLKIHVELKPDAKVSEKRKREITNLVVKVLLLRNSEYRNNYFALRKRVVPELIFHPYGDPSYFKEGIKQKWVKA